MFGSEENCNFATARPAVGLALNTKGVSTCTWTCPGFSGGNGDVVSLLATATRSAGFDSSTFGVGPGCASARITGVVGGQPHSLVTAAFASSLPPRNITASSGGA